MAKKQPKRWVYSPSKPPKAAVPTAVKAEVEVRARELIDKVLKPKHVKPPPEDSMSNHLTDVTLRWHGSTLFLVAVYACPGPNAISPTFEDRFARLEHTGAGRFNLSFMRHTGQWVPLHQGLALDQCLEAIRDDPWFTP